VWDFETSLRCSHTQFKLQHLAARSWNIFIWNKHYAVWPIEMLVSKYTEIHETDKCSYYLRVEALADVVIYVAIFWDVAPCSPYMNWCFGRAYNPHLHGRKSSEQETSVKYVDRLATRFTVLSCSADFQSWIWRYVLLKRRFSHRLHGAIAQKRATFMFLLLSAV
jgi:hypothetical protein